jgi:hypothetical protein
MKSTIPSTHCRGILAALLSTATLVGFQAHLVAAACGSVTALFETAYGSKTKCGFSECDVSTPPVIWTKQVVTFNMTGKIVDSSSGITEQASMTESSTYTFNKASCSESETDITGSGTYSETGAFNYNLDISDPDFNRVINNDAYFFMLGCGGDIESICDDLSYTTNCTSDVNELKATPSTCTDDNGTTYDYSYDWKTNSSVPFTDGDLNTFLQQQVTSYPSTWSSGLTNQASFHFDTINHLSASGSQSLIQFHFYLEKDQKAKIVWQEITIYDSGSEATTTRSIPVTGDGNPQGQYATDSVKMPGAPGTVTAFGFELLSDDGSGGGGDGSPGSGGPS